MALSNSKPASISGRNHQRVQGATDQPSVNKNLISTDIKEKKMAYENLVAVYDTPPHAEAAVKALNFQKSIQ